MRGHEVVAVALGGVALCVGLPAGAVDWTPGEHMQTAVVKVAVIASELAERTGLGFDQSGVMLYGGYIREGQSLSMTRPLTGGKRYAFIGAGDADVRDVDLVVKDANGRVVARDTLKDSVPLIDFRPAKSGKYTFRISLPATTASASFVAVALLQSGGYDVPHRNLARSLGKAMDGAGGASARMNAEFGGGLRFHEGNGDWCLYAAVLEQGEALRVSGMVPSTQVTAVIAASDGVSTDVDLVVRDSRGRLVGKDDEPDDAPVVLVTGAKRVSHEIKFANAKSSGPSLVTMLVLDVTGLPAELTGHDDDTIRRKRSPERPIRPTSRSVDL